MIHNGIDLNAVSQHNPAVDALVKRGVDPDRPYVLFVGRITRQKGIIHLVNAIPAIDPSIQVVLCAGAPDTPEIGREMADRVAEVSADRPGVIWIQEMLPRDEVIQFYSHAAVFCCPSVYEPFGIINLEAMACETAVVASAVGGIPEVVVPGETGLLVDLELKPGTFDPVDPAKFSRGSGRRDQSRSRSNPALREKFGRNGRRRVEDHFSWTAIAHRTLDLYRSLCHVTKRWHDRAAHLVPQRADSRRRKAVQPEEGRTRVIIEDVTPRGGRWRISDQTHRRRHGDRRSRRVYRRPRRDLLCAAVPQGGRLQSGPKLPWSRWSTTAGRARSRCRNWAAIATRCSAWVDHFKTWSRDLAKRVEANQDVAIDLLIGAEMVAAAGKHAPPARGWLARPLRRIGAGWRIGRHRAGAFARVGRADAT